MILIIYLAGGKVNWLKKLFGFNKSIEQRLKSNYTFYSSLGITLEQEWEKEENLALLMLEKTGVGG